MTNIVCNELTETLKSGTIIVNDDMLAIKTKVVSEATGVCYDVMEIVVRRSECETYSEYKNLIMNFINATM